MWLGYLGKSTWQCFDFISFWPQTVAWNKVTVPSKMIFFWEEDAEQNSEEELKNCWIEEPREIFFVENKE